MESNELVQGAEGSELGVVDRVVLAFKPKNKLATVLGFIAGGAVPIATFLEAHYDLDRSLPLHAQVTTYIVLGGLIVSAKTVYAWAKLAFDDAFKAVGFVVLLEGVMITSQVPVLPLAILALLIGINGVACGCILSLGRAPKAKRVVEAEAPKAKAKRAPRVKRAPASEKRTVSGIQAIKVEAA
jgi:hypothetical protein